MDPHFDGVIFQTHGGEVERRLKRPFPPYCLLDVRSLSDYAAGHIPGARHVDPQELSQGFPEGTAAQTEFIVTGADWADERVRQASLALRELGARRVVEFSGGLDEWKGEGFDLETGR